MKHGALQIHLLCQILCTASAYRIFGMFPMPAQSHYNFNKVIMRSLAANGHQVVVATPFINQPPMENYTLIDLSKDMDFYINSSSPEDFSEMSLYQLLDLFWEHDRDFCERILRHEEVQKIFNSEKKLFDVIFVELLGIYECYLPLARKWNIPIIGIITLPSWFTAEKSIDNPRSPSYTLQGLIFPLNLSTLLGRLKNTLNYVWIELLDAYITTVKGREFYNNNEHLLRECSGYAELKPSLVFFNSHFSMFSRSLNPNAIEIGGIHVQKAKPLSEEVQKFIDDAKYGVILFTLGSVVVPSTVRNETTVAFKEAFRSIPQRVIWKYDGKLENLPKNVMLLSWLPQRDILEQDNVKAVISHCGISGTYEIIHTGTPVIATPLFGDQECNARMLEEKGAAIVLDIKTVTKEIVLEGINSIVNDTRYLTNMKKLSKAFRDRPMSPTDTVNYWTEYVVRHNGAPHLKTKASELNIFQYLLIDVILCILIFIGSVVFVIRWIMSIIKNNYCKSYERRNSGLLKKLS